MSLLGPCYIRILRSAGWFTWCGAGVSTRRRRVGREVIVVNCNSSARLSRDVAGVAQAFEHQAILAMECIDAATVENKGKFDPGDISRYPAT